MQALVGGLKGVSSYIVAEPFENGDFGSDVRVESATETSAYSSENSDMCKAVD